MNAVFPWLTSNTKIDYPFTARRADGLHELFVDAYVIHTELRDKDQLLKIAEFNPAGTLELRFEDDTLLESLTSLDGFISSVFGSYTVYEWRKSTSLGSGLAGNDIVARLTVLTAKLADFAFPIAPANAFLQASLVNASMSRIRRIGTAIGGIPCCIAITDKDVILEAGNNVELQLKEEQEVIQAEIITQTQEVRTPATIVLSTRPGAGTGRFPTCTSIGSEIRRLGGVGGDSNGNVALSLDDCLWSEFRLAGPTSPPIHPYTDYLATLEEALLQLHANCKACCDCPDYGAVYAQLSNAFSRAKSVAARIEVVRVRYQDLVDDVNALIAERQTGITIKLRVQVGPDFSMSILGTIGNNSCVEKHNVSFRFTVPDSGAEYIAASGRMEAEEFHDIQIDPDITTAGDSKLFSFATPSIKGAKYARTRFSVRIGPGATNRAGKQLIILAEALQDAVVVDNDEVLIELKGPLEKT